MLAAGVLFASCGDEPSPDKPLASVTERTVLIYQVANRNGLDGNCGADSAEMLKAAENGMIPENCRVIVFNRRTGRSQSLMELTEKGFEPIKTYTDDYSSVDGERMLEVFNDLEKYAPAKSYGLIFWGHGTGWLQDGKQKAPQRRSYGGDNREWMNITTLRTTLSLGPRFDYLYFDCCFMAGVEVAYELADVSPYMAFSTMEIAAEGMPYDRTLGSFFRPMPEGLIDAASKTVDYYREWKQIGTRPEFSLSSFGGRYCTMSVVETAHLQTLASAVKTVYEKTPSANPSDMTPQRYGRGLYVSYYFDLGKYVSDLCVDSAGTERFEGATDALGAVNSALEKCVIYNGYMDYVFGGATPLLHCSGLSTYIMTSPGSSTTKNYKDLSWYSDIASRLTIE